MEADESCRQLLVQLSSELAQLCAVLAALAAASETLTQQGLQDLQTRQNVTGLVLLYTQVTGTQKTPVSENKKKSRRYLPVPVSCSNLLFFKPTFRPFVARFPAELVCHFCFHCIVTF